METIGHKVMRSYEIHVLDGICFLLTVVASVKGYYLRCAGQLGQ